MKFISNDPLWNVQSSLARRVPADLRESVISMTWWTGADSVRISHGERQKGSAAIPDSSPIFSVIGVPLHAVYSDIAERARWRARGACRFMPMTGERRRLATEKPVEFRAVFLQSGLLRDPSKVHVCHFVPAIVAFQR